MLFSQRMKYKPIKSVIQVESMDADLRNSLWNMIKVHYWDKMAFEWLYENPFFSSFVNIIWKDYFKATLDTIPQYWENTYKILREYFFECEWCEVYDFIEFIVNNYPYQEQNEKFMKDCNKILERELSAYRFVSGKITRITSDYEIQEIEETLSRVQPLNNVYTHLKHALDLMSDRKNPDYRNSIKESISAVESLCIRIVKDPKATLGKALNKLEDNNIELHTALKVAFSKIYGYTSDAQGIRHALLDEPNLCFEDAKFMLISCSAFINYLIEKSAKAEIEL